MLLDSRADCKAAASGRLLWLCRVCVECPKIICTPLSSRHSKYTYRLSCSFGLYLSDFYDFFKPSSLSFKVKVSSKLKKFFVKLNFKTGMFDQDVSFHHSMKCKSTHRTIRFIISPNIGTFCKALQKLKLLTTLFTLAALNENLCIKST